MVNNIIVILICAVAGCGIQVNADLRFANLEWNCSVGRGPKNQTVLIRLP